MGKTPWPGIGAALVLLLVVVSCSPAPQPSASGSAPPPPDPSVAASATPRPEPGHELYGFVPYWEMDDTIAAHLRTTPLTTVALFSVTNTGRGKINTGLPGYRAISGAVGSQVIREAHERHVRVEVVFTSFGLERNQSLFASTDLQDATITSLVRLVAELDVDGINVDVESLDPLLIPAYGAFVGRLRQAVIAADPRHGVSVATTANAVGAAMALAATTAGADRVFMMGYDYRTSGSSPGATAPLARRDGSDRDLRSSLDLYALIGVPVARTILGLPLYGMSWPVVAPEVGAPEAGAGEVWIPRRNLSLLEDPSVVPILDEVESVEVYLLASDGSVGPPSWWPASEGPGAPGDPAAASSVAPASPLPSVGVDVTWRAVYVDSPRTLAPKLALANERGLAGAGFWAIGYERGLPGYTDLMTRFAAGKPVP